MTLELLTDHSGAQWLIESPLAWNRLVTFGPDGFDAYARLRFVPDPGAGSTDRDLTGADRPPELDQFAHALRVLAAFTTTPGDASFAMWDGYGDMPVPPGAALFGIPDHPHPYRRYVHFRGSLDEIDTWAQQRGPGSFSPAFVWPRDRAWCIARDVDPHWAGIGGPENAIAALLADPALDIVRADPSEPQPDYWR